MRYSWFYVHFSVIVVLARHGHVDIAVRSDVGDVLVMAVVLATKIPATIMVQVNVIYVLINLVIDFILYLVLALRLQQTVTLVVQPMTVHIWQPVDIIDAHRIQVYIMIYIAFVVVVDYNPSGEYFDLAAKTKKQTTAV